MTLEELRNKLADMSDRTEGYNSEVYVAHIDDDDDEALPINDVLLDENGDVIILV